VSDLKAWRRLGGQVVHRRERALLREDELELPDGGRRRYPVLQLGESAAVVPLTGAGEIILVRQYRHVPGEFCWEIPGGGVQAGESPEAAAQRELREEVGYRAGRLDRLGTFWPNNAYLDEVIHVYLAADLAEDPLPADQDEHLERGLFPFDEALAMAHDDRIGCGLTKLAIFWTALRKEFRISNFEFRNVA
jgi:ADP-ribose pyrophosphatase